MVRESVSGRFVRVRAFRSRPQESPYLTFVTKWGISQNVDMTPSVVVLNVGNLVWDNNVPRPRVCSPTALMVDLKPDLSKLSEQLSCEQTELYQYGFFRGTV